MQKSELIESFCHTLSRRTVSLLNVARVKHKKKKYIYKYVTKLNINALTTDAPGVSIGGILSQGKISKDKHRVYTLRSLNYCTDRKPMVENTIFNVKPEPLEIFAS